MICDYVILRILASNEPGLGHPMPLWTHPFAPETRIITMRRYGPGPELENKVQRSAGCGNVDHGVRHIPGHRHLAHGPMVHV